VSPEEGRRKRAKNKGKRQENDGGYERDAQGSTGSVLGRTEVHAKVTTKEGSR
jgi:hypothetical protein